MVYLLKYAPVQYPANIKVIPSAYPTKADALAAIIRREAIRQIESAYGAFRNQASACIWMIEQMGETEAERLLARTKTEESERPFFAR